MAEKCLNTQVCEQLFRHILRDDHRSKSLENNAHLLFTLERYLLYELGFSGWLMYACLCIAMLSNLVYRHALARAMSIT